MDLKDIKELIRFFDKSGICELELEEGDSRLYLSKNSTGYHMPMMQPPVMQSHVPLPQPAFEAPAGSPVIAKDTKGKLIESPIIGTYYQSSSPGADAFVKVGDIVEKGQTLCIIEAMKIMNTIEAEYRCKILEIFVENGKPVEYGQDLFMVEPM